MCIRDRFKPFKYRIRRGNNSIVIKQAFKARPWWVKAKKDLGLGELNAIWVPGRNKEFIDLLKDE